MSHKGHPKCEHKSQAACDRARQELFGKCTELTQDKKQPTQCVRWGTSWVHDRSMCDMHAGMVIEREAAAGRAAAEKKRVNDITTAAIRATGQEPHECDKPLCRSIHRSLVHVCEPGCSEWVTAPG